MLFRSGFDMERLCGLEESNGADKVKGVEKMSDKVRKKEIERGQQGMTMIARWEYGVWIIWAPL